MSYRRLISLLVGLALLSPLVACGRKTPPVPPGTVRPKEIKDLHYTITAKGVELGWSVPVRNRDGSPLARIQGFQVFKAESPLGESCDGCPPAFGKPIAIAFDAKPEEARKMYYEDRTLRSGMRYVYEIRTVKGWFNVSDPSNRVSLTWHTPPSPPAALVAQPEQEGVSLVWNPSTTWTDGRRIDAPLAYRVFRARKGEDRWKAVPGLMNSTEYLDTAIKKGIGYRYRVAAVLLHHGTEIESAPSAEAGTKPLDLTPPAAPRGLVVLHTPKGVELLWQENGEPDLNGYFVYRQGPDELVDQLNNAPLRITRFVDRTKLPNGKHHYWVTAVDQAEPPNESRPSKMAEHDVSE
jgi:hypothetical protein